MGVCLQASSPQCSLLRSLTIPTGSSVRKEDHAKGKAICFYVYSWALTRNLVRQQVRNLKYTAEISVFLFCSCCRRAHFFLLEQMSTRPGEKHKMQDHVLDYVKKTSRRPCHQRGVSLPCSTALPLEAFLVFSTLQKPGTKIQADKERGEMTKGSQLCSLLALGSQVLGSRMCGTQNQ